MPLSRTWILEAPMAALDALITAKNLRPGNTIFSYLEVGDRFRFGYSNGDKSPLYVKTARGYRAAGGTGHVYKTGANTAVFKESA